MLLSEIKDLIFLVKNFSFTEIKLMYHVIIIYLQNLIIVTEVLKALHVLVVLERENLLEIR